MRKAILTVTLNPALDRTIIVENFKANKTCLQQKEFLTAGGKGINVSRALKGLGIESIAIGLVGGDRGREIKRLLKIEKITSRFIEIEGNTRVNLTIIDNARPNQRTRVLGLGPKVKQEEISCLKNRFNGLLRFGKFVVLSGKNSKGASEGLYPELIKLSKKANILTLLDTSGLSLARGIKAKPYIIKPNKEEIEELLNKGLGSLKRMKDAVLDVQKRGVKIVLLTLGPAGAIGSNGSEVWFARPPKVKAVNDVGCGDSFIAGFLFSFFKKQPFNRCLQVAVSAGTINAMSFVPGAISRKELTRLSGNIQLVKI